MTTPVPLAGYTTLRLGGPASVFLEATKSTEVIEAVRTADQAGEPLLVLGGGSNLVIGDAGFEGTVVRIATRGRGHDPLGDGLVRLTVEAGENWDDVVAGAVANDLGGLEALSGIPGLVGATPVQNVGAYGVEVADLLLSVDLLDRRSGQVRQVSTAELGLGYRTSVLKGTDNAVVLRVSFALRTGGQSAPVRYAELANTLGVELGARVPAAQVRDAVLALRTGKGMVLDADDHDTWSAGSFFTNPIVAEADLPRVLSLIHARLGQEIKVPRYPGGAGKVKLSAAWLIERAGFLRGHEAADGRVSLSHKHTLALTNRGKADTEDLLTLAREVRDGVRGAFEVDLHPEPVFVGCAL